MTQTKKLLTLLIHLPTTGRDNTLLFRLLETQAIESHVCQLRSS